MEQSPSWEANRFSGSVWTIRSMIRFCGDELLAPRPTPKLEDHPCRLSATAYWIYSQPSPVLETVLLSATWGRAIPWWQGPTYHGTYFLRHRNVYLCSVNKMYIYSLLINLEVIWAQFYIRLDYFIQEHFSKRLGYVASNGAVNDGL